MADTVLSVLASAFPEAEVRSGIAPTIRVATSPDPSRGSLLLKFIQPTVTLIDANGTEVYTLAPYGIPNPRTTAVRIATVLASVVVLLGITFVAGRASRG